MVKGFTEEVNSVARELGLSDELKRKLFFCARTIRGLDNREKIAKAANIMNITLPLGYFKKTEFSKEERAYEIRLPLEDNFVFEAKYQKLPEHIIRVNEGNIRNEVDGRKSIVQMMNEEGGKLFVLSYDESQELLISKKGDFDFSEKGFLRFKPKNEALVRLAIYNSENKDSFFHTKLSSLKGYVEGSNPSDLTLSPDYWVKTGVYNGATLRVPLSSFQIQFEELRNRATRIYYAPEDKPFIETLEHIIPRTIVMLKEGQKKDKVDKDYEIIHNYKHPKFREMGRVLTSLLN